MTTRSETNSRRPTMRDVAERAGVSKSLVSLVMRGEPMVRDEKRRRVQQAADELGYRPRLSARQPHARSKIVGVVLADPRNPLLIDVVERVARIFDDEGLSMLLVTAGASVGPTPPHWRDDRIVGALKDLGVEAVLVVGSVPDSEELIDALADIPVVVAAADADVLRADMVRSDDHLGMRLVVDYLVAAGHSAIAHLGGLGGDVARERVAGYRAGMARHGLESAVVVAESDLSEDAGYRGAAQLLRGPQPVTAIVAVNDLAAVGAMSAIVDAGLRVPDDVAVAGYDDTFVSAIRQVSLTSVDPDSHRIGSLAAQCVLRRIADPGRSSQVHLLPPRLVTRHSTSGLAVG